MGVPFFCRKATRRILLLTASTHLASLLCVCVYTQSSNFHPISDVVKAMVSSPVRRRCVLVFITPPPTVMEFLLVSSPGGGGCMWMGANRIPWTVSGTFLRAIFNPHATAIHTYKDIHTYVHRYAGDMKLSWTNPEVFYFSASVCFSSPPGFTQVFYYSKFVYIYISIGILRKF